MAGNKALRGRRAIVTGASQGIGKAIAIALARHGVRVCLVARRQKGLESALRALSRWTPDALAVPADVTSQRSVRSMVKRAAEALGGVDILVNSAGYAAFLPLEKTSEAEWDTMVDTNLKGTFLTMREVLPFMERQGRGDIVNIASVAGLVPLANASAYCASKFGVVGLSRAVAQELRGRGQHGIRVITLCPGATDSPLWDAVGQSPERSRMLKPEDVADAVVGVLALSPRAVVEQLILTPPEGVL